MKHFRALFPVAGLMATLFFVSVVSAQEINSPIGAKHVVLIGYDGYGGHYVHWDELPALTKLRDGGAWTLNMRCVLPSVSAINWATMLMGSGSELHGYRTWGSRVPDLPSRVLTENGKYPDIFYVIKKCYPDSTLFAAYSWDVIGDLIDAGAANETKSIGERADSIFDYKGKGEIAKEDGTKTKITYPDAEQVCEVGIKYLEQNPTFTFLYFSEPDCVGHTCGWGTPQYYETVQRQDKLLGKIIDYLEANDRFKDTVVIFISDHGGTDKGHGGEIMEHMEVPFIIYGCGVKPGEISDVVMNYDVAATIAWILGADTPQCWRGKPVTSAFGQ